MTALVAALQFLLVTPAFVRRAFTAQELGRATAFYPLVGLLLGGLLALADFLLGYLFPIEVRSALALALWILLTGALHFDGFLDSCDGLLGGATPERRMEIMRDERTGAFGLAGGALMLLILFSALNAVEAQRWVVLLVAPVLGRWAMTLAVVIFPYARPEGLGRDIKDNAHSAQAIIATVTMLIIVDAVALVRQDFAPLVAVVAAAAVCWLSAVFVLRRIPGMTGDTYGAINLLVEASVLLTFVAMR
jgi:adenosylcobinamide-GDP ribazoletransferase